jgi:ABC-type Fe3+ transport system substrate-binding protein
MFAGCAGRGPEPIRLVLISPHRDEVREEVGLAFRDWVQERTLTRHHRVCSALKTWLAGDASERAAVDHALKKFLNDWRSDDVNELLPTVAAWRNQPTHEHGEALLTALAGWEARVRPIELVWQDIGGGTSQIARYVGARFETNPDGIGIDLVFGGGTDIYLRFAEQGMLQSVELPQPILSRIRPELNGVPLYDPQGRWYGPMLSSFGILCNRVVLGRIGQPEPVAWADLGEPGLQGWVSAGDPRLTGSVHMVYEIILQGKGWDRGMRLLLRLGANTHSFLRDSGTLTRTVANGEVAAAGNLDANALTAVGRDPGGMAYNLPPGETLINPDAIAVFRGAPRAELARAFVEFTLSDAGQQLFILLPGQPGGPRRYPLCRLSVVEELYARYPAEVRSIGPANPFQAGNIIRYDSKLGNRRWDALNDLFGTWVVDAQPELSAAWRAVLRSPLSPNQRQHLEEDLFRAPCSEQELKDYAERIASGGSRERTERLNRWGEEARQRYRAVRRQAEQP